MRTKGQPMRVSKDGVSWHPSRNCYRAMVGGKTFYFSDALKASQLEAEAIRATWASLKRQGATEWPQGQPNRFALRQALGLLSPAEIAAAAVLADPNFSQTKIVPANVPPAVKVSRSALTIRQAADLFLSEREAETLSDRTKLDERHRMGKVVAALGEATPLASLDHAALQTFVAHWRNPKNASGIYAKHIVACCKRFLSWAADHDKIKWVKPNRFDSLLLIEADKPRNEAERETLKAKVWGEDNRHFTIEQMRDCYAKADTELRAYLLLAMNCAYYPSDIAKLKHSDIKVNGVSWIQTLRGKTLVPSKHVLWAETLEAMKNVWTHGKTLVFGKYANLEKRIPMLFRPIKEKVGCPDFKFLRHTSANEIRKIAGAEIASLHLAHTEGNKMLGVYTDSLRDKHAEAVDLLRSAFAPVWQQ